MFVFRINITLLCVCVERWETNKSMFSKQMYVCLCVCYAKIMIKKMMMIIDKNFFNSHIIEVFWSQQKKKNRKKQNQNTKKKFGYFLQRNFSGNRNSFFLFLSVLPFFVIFFGKIFLSMFLKDIFCSVCSVIWLIILSIFFCSLLLKKIEKTTEKKQKNKYKKMKLE